MEGFSPQKEIILCTLEMIVLMLALTKLLVNFPPGYGKSIILYVLGISLTMTFVYLFGGSKKIVILDPVKMAEYVNTVFASFHDHIKIITKIQNNSH